METKKLNKWLKIIGFWGFWIFVFFSFVLAVIEKIPEKDPDKDKQEISEKSSDHGFPRHTPNKLVATDSGVEFTTHCQGPDVIGILPESENEITIEHVRFEYDEKKNRCSQEGNGAIPLSGWRVGKEWIKHLPLPDKPPGNSFVLRDLKTGEIVAWANIDNPRLKRPVGYPGALQVEHFLNIPTNTFSWQTGYDGSSVTFRLNGKIIVSSSTSKETGASAGLPKRLGIFLSKNKTTLLKRRVVFSKRFFLNLDSCKRF